MTDDSQDYCRRLKMKCLGKENPPCQRCRGAKKPCTFGAEAKVKQPSGTQAIDKCVIIPDYLALAYLAGACKDSKIKWDGFSRLSKR